VTKPGRRLSRSFPKSMPAHAGMTTGASLVGLFMSCAAAVAERTVRRSMDPTRRSTIASTAGAVVAAGRRSSTRWWTVPNDTRSIDSTSIKVQRSAAGGKGGAQKQAIGRSRGGRTTKIHGVIDSQGQLFRFILTPGNIADITAAHELAPKLPSNGCLIGDMGYDAKTSTAKPTKPAILSSAPGVGSKISAASPLAMTSLPAILLQPWLWQPSLFGGLIESGP
jgi:hypothetical protein